MIDGASPAGIKAAYEALQGLLNIRDWTQNADAKLAVANAISGLADAKIELSQLKIENDKLKEEIEKNNKNIHYIEKLRRKNELFFDENEKLYKCPTCIEVQEIAVSLVCQHKNSSYLHCNKCNNKFLNPDHVPEDWGNKVLKSDFSVI